MFVWHKTIKGKTVKGKTVEGKTNYRQLAVVCVFMGAKRSVQKETRFHGSVVCFMVNTIVKHP